MKYEAVFGDQSLFDGCYDETASIVIATSNGLKFVDGEFTEYGIVEGDVKSDGLRIAMRRIIRTPTWTVEDQKAGRLPDIGSKAVSVYGFCVVDILAVRNGCVVACNSDISDARPCVFTIDNFLELFTPIESPEEKAARLRKEWCIKALSSCSILSGMQKYELKRLGGYIEDIHDALLTGDLPVPGKE